MAGNSNPSKLDQQQILQRAFDESTDTLRVSGGTGGGGTGTGGTTDVLISDVDDSIKIGNGSGVRFMAINADGSINVVTTSTLPAGAATSAKQDTGNSSLSSIDTKLGGTIAVSAASLPLPTGASTAANQATANTSLSSIDTKLSGVSTASGQAGMQTTLTSIDNKTPALVSGNQPVAVQASVTPADIQVTGSLTNGTDTVSIATNGESTTVFEIAGVWSGTFIFESSNNNFSTFQPVAAVFLGGLASQSSNFTANGFYSVLTAGFQKVRVRFLTYTSGTATVLANTSSGNRISVALQGNPVNLQTLSSQGPRGASATSWLVDGSAVTQPISAASLPLPTGASTSALQTTGNTSLSNIDTKTPVLGQTTMSLSQPVTLASDQPAIPVSNPDLFVTGQSAQTAIINNIIPATASANANDVSGYRSGSIQIVSTGTAGTFILEGSNDNVNFQAVQWYNQAIPGTPIIAAITATASQLIYVFPIKTKYLRVRIVTAITGGSIQAFTRISQESWSPAVQTVYNTTAANLNATVAGSLTTVASVTAANLTFATATDIASAAITASATSAGIAMTNVQSMAFSVVVTAVSGTTPTLDVVVQQSWDNTNWFDVYHFERITAAGTYIAPRMHISGIYIRYVRTVAGTTPSFTMSLIRTSGSGTGPTLRRIFDRVIGPNVLNSTTVWLFTEGADELQIIQSSAAGATVNPVITLEGSEDQTNVYTIMNSAGTGITLTASPSTTSASFVGALPKWTRARITTAGTGAVFNYVALKCRGGS